LVVVGADNRRVSDGVETLFFWKEVFVPL